MQDTDPNALSRLLEDEAEQRETFEYLRDTLDRKRPADDKLFS